MAFTSHYQVMKLEENEEEKASRHCWECLRRRVVCDRVLPTCIKCLRAGKQCPGYDEQRPLQWIENGKVTSRRAKKEITPKLPPRSSPSEISYGDGYDQTIQQLSIYVLTVVKGRIGPQQQSTAEPVGVPSQYPKQGSAFLPIPYPQYPLTNAKVPPSNDIMQRTMHHQIADPVSTTNLDLARGIEQNRQEEQTTFGGMSTITTYQQMSIPSSNDFDHFSQTQ